MCVCVFCIVCQLDSSVSEVFICLFTVILSNEISETIAGWI